MPQKSLESLSILMVVPSIVQGAILQRSIDQHTKVSIRQCANIAQAIEAMSDVHPDLVISSMYFNDGEGIGLLRAMQERPTFEHILFMLISSEERFEVLDPIRQSGVIAVLPKPFTSEHIQKALDQTVLYLANNAEVEQHKDIATIRILVVDDSRLARRHLIKILIKGGVTEDNIIQAEDGAHAYASLIKQPFDIVLTDYNMPNMNGGELLISIRGNDDINHLPTIMITSERNDSVLHDIQENGVTALLDKPFDPQQLMYLLNTCV